MDTTHYLERRFEGGCFLLTFCKLLVMTRLYETGCSRDKRVVCEHRGKGKCETEDDVQKLSSSEF